MIDIDFKAWVKHPTFYLKKNYGSNDNPYLPKNIMVDVQTIYLSTNKIRGKWQDVKPDDEIDYIIAETKGSSDFKEFILLPYTGLKDKNGVKIYKGSIVQSSNSERFIVEYWSGQILVSWYLRSINSGDTSELDCFGEYEVIGNIYENPELLGSEDK